MKRGVDTTDGVCQRKRYRLTARTTPCDKVSDGAWFFVGDAESHSSGHGPGQGHDHAALPVRPVGWHEVMGLAPLMVLIVVIGVYPRPFFERFLPTVAAIAARFSGPELHLVVQRDAALAAQGVLTVAIDVRQPPEAGYPASVQDMNFAVRRLNVHGADVGGTSRVGALGVSSGGHLGLFMGREALHDHWPALLAGGRRRSVTRTARRPTG